MTGQPQPQATTEAPVEGVRAVTDEEVAAYREQGWAKLDGLLTPPQTSALLERIQARMGTDASATVDTRPAARGLQKSTSQLSAMWQLLENPSRQDQWINAWSHSPAMAGWRLGSSASPPGSTTTR